MPNGMSERSVLIEHCGVGGSVRKDTLYPILSDSQNGGLLHEKGGKFRLLLRFLASSPTFFTIARC